MRARGLILIDTKNEFGLDRDGVLHAIGEVNTLDSPRPCDAEEWEENYSRVATATATGRHNTVTAVIVVQPELSIKEFSKQYVRDVLLGLGLFNPAKDTEAPKLSEEAEIVEDALFWNRGPKAVALAPTTWARIRVCKPITILTQVKEVFVVIPLIILLLLGDRMTASPSHRLDS